MTRLLRIGNAQGFWGDSPLAPLRLVSQQPDLDYLTLDYLAEVSLSIMAIQRDKDPSAGYAKNFLDVVRSLIPFWKNGSSLKIVTNAGGLNPLGCARAVSQILLEQGLSSMKVGVVFGDDVLNILKESTEQESYRNIDTEESIGSIRDQLIAANAYLGAEPIAQALNQEAQIVITGRVADPSLTVGPCMAHFGWSPSDYDALAGATVAGHLIECGAQATGGIWSDWLTLEDPANIGFPFVEVHKDGSFALGKPEGTGGLISPHIVKEQLLYEIGDPDNYLSPDATVSFLDLQLAVENQNRIHISGARGFPPTSYYKVSASYRDGYKVEGFLAMFSYQAVLKARKTGEAIFQKLYNAGYSFERTNLECIGGGDVVPGIYTAKQKDEVRECMLRISAADSEKEPLEALAAEIASMVTAGPQGVTGYSSGKSAVRPVFGYWPCLIPRNRVVPKVDVF
jgi:hypothetical protein